MNWLKKRGPAVLMHILALLPLAWLIRDLLLGQLTADPVREIQLRTGLYALILLTISLAGTPLYTLLRASYWRQLRRLAGLYAFAYASLHLLNLVVLDYGFNWAFLWQDVIEKRFAIAGLASFICLTPVAITSTSGWQRRLGRRWPQLHRLVYPAALLAAIHFVWQAKIDTRLPWAVATLIIVLLLLRLPVFSRSLGRAGRRIGKINGI